MNEDLDATDETDPHEDFFDMKDHIDNIDTMIRYIQESYKALKTSSPQVAQRLAEFDFDRAFTSLQEDATDLQDITLDVLNILEDQAALEGEAQ